MLNKNRIYTHMNWFEHLDLMFLTHKMPNLSQTRINLVAVINSYIPPMIKKLLFARINILLYKIQYGSELQYTVESFKFFGANTCGLWAFCLFLGVKFRGYVGF